MPKKFPCEHSRHLLIQQCSHFRGWYKKCMTDKENTYKQQCLSSKVLTQSAGMILFPENKLEEVLPSRASSSLTLFCRSIDHTIQGCALAKIFCTILLNYSFSNPSGEYLQTRSNGKLFNLKTKNKTQDVCDHKICIANTVALVSHSKTELQSFMDSFFCAPNGFSLKNVIMGQ